MQDEAASAQQALEETDRKIKVVQEAIRESSIEVCLCGGGAEGDFLHLCVWWWWWGDNAERQEAAARQEAIL